MVFSFLSSFDVFTGLPQKKAEEKSFGLLVTIMNFSTVDSVDE